MSCNSEEFDSDINYKMTTILIADLIPCDTKQLVIIFCRFHSSVMRHVGISWFVTET